MGGWDDEQLLKVAGPGQEEGKRKQGSVGRELPGPEQGPWGQLRSDHEMRGESFHLWELWFRLNRGVRAIIHLIHKPVGRLG